MSGLVSESKSLAPLKVNESPEDKFREFLEIRGEKLTEPRRVMLRHIFDSHKHFDADELVADLRNVSPRPPSRSTVYRTLKLLVDAGLLREFRLTNRTVYEHNYGYPSHDHLHCTSCGKIVEFCNGEVRKIRDAVCREQGFRPAEHWFVISGICAECARSRNRRRRLDLI